MEKRHSTNLILFLGATALISIFLYKKLKAKSKPLPLHQGQDNGHRAMANAGTGFMATLTDALNILTEQGYTENLVSKFDHFECQSGKFKLYPNQFSVDKMVRFENSSDPDDQAILYALSSGDVRGVYVDSYGLYHDSLSKEILEKFRESSYH